MKSLAIGGLSVLAGVWFGSALVILAGVALVLFSVYGLVREDI